MVYQKGYKKTSTWINKFPIYALVYKEAAEMLGYDEKEAKSLGTARAISFAVAERGSSKEVMYDEAMYDVVNFAGLETCCVLDSDGDIRAFLSGRVIQPEDFDKAVVLRIIDTSNRETYEKIREYIVGELSQLSEHGLNSSAVFEICTSLCDIVRAIEFMEKKSTEVST